jgi:hypothetical protein
VFSDSRHDSSRQAQLIVVGDSNQTRAMLKSFFHPIVHVESCVFARNGYGASTLRVLNDRTLENKLILKIYILGQNNQKKFNLHNDILIQMKVFIALQSLHDEQPDDVGI